MAIGEAIVLNREVDESVPDKMTDDIAGELTDFNEAVRLEFTLAIFRLTGESRAITSCRRKVLRCSQPAANVKWWLADRRYHARDKRR